jgi:hypothetical protein
MFRPIYTIEQDQTAKVTAGISSLHLMALTNPWRSPPLAASAPLPPPPPCWRKNSHPYSRSARNRSLVNRRQTPGLSRRRQNYRPSSRRARNRSLGHRRRIPGMIHRREAGAEAEAEAEAEDALGGGSGGAAPAASRGAVSSGAGLLVGAACLLPRRCQGGCRALRPRQPGGRQVSGFASCVASVLSLLDATLVHFG